MIIAIPTFMREDNQKCFDNLPESIQKQTILFTHSGRAAELIEQQPHALVVDLGTTDGIADVRQQVIDTCYSMGHHKVFIMDDGCRFKKRVDMKLVPMEEEDYWEMFNLVDIRLDDYPMVGISDQAGNNRVEEDLKEIQRSYSCYGVNIDTLRENSIRFDAMYQEDPEIKLYEDFHLILNILTKGLKNAVLFNYAFSHSHGKKGGNSAIRTNSLQKKCIEALMKRYPGLVKLVKKDNPAWKAGLDDEENFRWEVQVEWKKAFKASSDVAFGSSLDDFFS